MIGLSQWPDLPTSTEAGPLQDIAEKEPCQNDCSSADPSNKNRSALKSQTSLDDDYFDFDRHRPLESLVDLAQQEWMNEHSGSIDLPILSSSHNSSSGSKGNKKSTSASIINNNDLFYTPQDVSGHHQHHSINFIGERLRAPSNNLNSSKLLCSDEGYLDMTLGLRDLRVHSGALPVSNIKWSFFIFTQTRSMFKMQFSRNHCTKVRVILRDILDLRTIIVI